MKRFITKVLIFSISIAVFIAGFYAFRYHQKKNEEILLPKKNIIIGDSNTRWSISDSILANYYNYSTGGETYLFAYTKLKLFEKNNRIDTLLLSFSPHNIINNIWWDDDVQQPLRNRMPAFYQNFTFDDHKIFIKYLPKNYLASLAEIGKSETSFLFQTKGAGKSHSRFGSYLPEKRNENEFEREPYHYKTPELTKPETDYLEKIVKDCKTNNIHLILINPPKNYLRPDYSNYAHKEFYTYYREHLSDTDFLDFSQLPVPKNGYYDMNHVSKVGAEYFSRFLQEKGIRNLLNSKYNLKP